MHADIKNIIDGSHLSIINLSSLSHEGLIFTWISNFLQTLTIVCTVSSGTPHLPGTYFHFHRSWLYWIRNASYLYYTAGIHIRSYLYHTHMSQLISKLLTFGLTGEAFSIRIMGHKCYKFDLQVLQYLNLSCLTELLDCVLVEIQPLFLREN